VPQDSRCKQLHDLVTHRGPQSLCFVVDEEPIRFRFPRAERLEVFTVLSPIGSQQIRNPRYLCSREHKYISRHTALSHSKRTSVRSINMQFEWTDLKTYRFTAFSPHCFDLHLFPSRRFRSHSPSHALTSSTPLSPCPHNQWLTGAFCSAHLEWGTRDT